MTWTPELPAHELLLCPAPRYTEQAADRHSTFWRSWRRGCFSRQTSLRLTSLTDRPAAQRALASGPIPHPYRTLSAPWVALVPCFRADSHFDARNCPHQPSLAQPRLGPKPVSPWLEPGLGTFSLPPEPDWAKEVGCGFVFTRVKSVLGSSLCLSWNV